jgi:hypothetical protein
MTSDKGCIAIVRHAKKASRNERIESGYKGIVLRRHEVATETQFSQAVRIATQSQPFFDDGESNSSQKGRLMRKTERTAEQADLYLHNYPALSGAMESWIVNPAGLS